MRHRSYSCRLVKTKSSSWTNYWINWSLSWTYRTINVLVKSNWSGIWVCIIFFLWQRLLPAFIEVTIILFQHNILIANWTYLRSSSTLLHMLSKHLFRNLLFTKIAESRFWIAICDVILYLLAGEWEFTILTLLWRVELFLMILFEIDIVHLPTKRTYFEVAPAVWEVTVYFRLWELFETVLASLGFLARHLYKFL